MNVEIKIKKTGLGGPIGQYLQEDEYRDLFSYVLDMIADKEIEDGASETVDFNGAQYYVTVTKSPESPESSE